jgi:thiol-disulfide isomerase/thioredoxin
MKNKKLLLLLAFLSITTISSANVNWMTSYEDAVKLSKLLNKPLLIDFWAVWCGPCQKMDEDVWSKEEINSIMENYIPVKIDIDYNRNLAAKYSVRSIPYVVVVDSWENVLYQSNGYKNLSQVSKFLKEFAINLTLVNQALHILEKDTKNPNAALRVALKYQDMGFVLEGDAKNAFLKQSNQYLKMAKKSVPKNDNIMVEKIELLGLVTKAYFNNYSAVSKQLEKEFKVVDKSNEAIFYYLHFLIYHNDSDAIKAQEMFKNLENSELSTSYLIKANSLLKV